MITTPFRALFLLRNALDSIEVIPLGGPATPMGECLAGLLSGRDELLAFIREVGFDSIVESYQVSDLPRTGFLYTFHIGSSPESIVELLARRIEPPIRAAYRVLELTAETSPEQLTLSPHEGFQLGASMLATADGLQRVASWFGKRVPVLA